MVRCASSISYEQGISNLTPLKLNSAALRNIQTRTAYHEIHVETASDFFATGQVWFRYGLCISYKQNKGRKV